MKTTLSVVLAFVITVSALGSTNPPKHSLSTTFSVNNFGGFNVHRQHNSAALNWIFNSPDVSSFIITRSYDGESFYFVSQQAPSNGHWNRFIDNTVEPGTNYYRITAVLKNGSREESPVQQIRIVRRR